MTYSLQETPIANRDGGLRISQTQPLSSEKKENEYFLRPDRLWLTSYQENVQPLLRPPTTEEIFSQSLFCQIDQLENKVNTYSLLDSEKKKISFKLHWNKQNKSSKNFKQKLSISVEKIVKA
jgi:hypothetical protein